MRANHRVASAVLAVVVAVTVAGCTAGGGVTDDGTGDPSPSDSAGAPTSRPTPQPESGPELVAGGSAADNQPYFDFVNEATLADGNPGGRAIVEGLVDAGFDKQAMEVTADRTPLGSAVDSLQFSVRIGDECLIGQADAGGYTSTLAPALQSGNCLIGNTRVIDW